MIKLNTVWAKDPKTHHILFLITWPQLTGTLVTGAKPSSLSYHADQVNSRSTQTSLPCRGKVTFHRTVKLPFVRPSVKLWKKNTQDIFIFTKAFLFNLLGSKTDGCLISLTNIDSIAFFNQQTFLWIEEKTNQMGYRPDTPPNSQN